MGGVARRAWARNEHSMETCVAFNETSQGQAHVTIPYVADDKMISDLVNGRIK